MRKTLTFDQDAIEAAVLAHAERENPGWRVVSCRLKGDTYFTEREPGMGVRAEVEVEDGAAVCRAALETLLTEGDP